MYVGVGYGDNPDTTLAGTTATAVALENARLNKGIFDGEGKQKPCSFALLFSTSAHDPRLLRDAVHSVIGADVPIYGGSAVGAITNEAFGYAGDQIAIALIWLDQVSCDFITEGGLYDDEKATGKRLGMRLKEHGAQPQTPVLLFYDSLDHSGEGMRMVMAAYLLGGIKESMGFLPSIVGAGLQGDYICSPVNQWINSEVDHGQVCSLVFGDKVQLDTVIMHGCLPATSYYTVTKADKQTILEINGVPALEFLDKILHSLVPIEYYPFNLVLGVNRAEDKWGEFDDSSYANRLCLGIDKERGGIVMFEPDLEEGTQFQIMYRSIDMAYIAPKIDALFAGLGDRRPVLATYIDCAGRAAGYGGTDMEDAIAVQKAVAGRVPLLGLYTGVEIAPVHDEPRGLDWTGVFTLFSVPK